MKHVVALTTPLPPSANHYRVPSNRGRGRLVLTREARAFHESTAHAGLGLTPIEQGKVRVEVQVFRGERNGKLQRGDLENYLKVLLDALQGIAYRNDSQVARIEAELLEDRARPRCEVRVESYLQATDGFTEPRIAKFRNSSSRQPTPATYRPGVRG